MEYLIVCLAALAASGLTLFSGFGLGTILTPVFALFFPVTTAVAMTAIVHLANNLFKIGLVGRDADWRIVARFGLPAALSAFLGAYVGKRLLKKSHPALRRADSGGNDGSHRHGTCCRIDLIQPTPYCHCWIRPRPAVPWRERRLSGPQVCHDAQ